jgi:hypothetical protein
MDTRARIDRILWSDFLIFLLKPLPTGEHKIGFKGISVDFTTGAKNTFVSDATYNVIVR